MNWIENCSLYLVISEEYGLGRIALEITDRAVSGGVDIIQLREKNKPRDELITLASKISIFCRKNNVIFIVNDDPDIAKESGACGVHLGQEDIKKYTISETRKIIGRDKLIGISTHSVSEAEKANEEDVDYIAFGPIFPTKTKKYFIGKKDIKEVCRIAKKPVFFIGGINLDNIDEVFAEGAKNVALIRDILKADDITGRVKEYKERVLTNGEGSKNDNKNKRPK